MTQVSALEFQRRFGAMQDAAQKEPVEITRHGRKVAVLVSADLFAALVARTQRSFLTRDMPQELLAVVKAARMDARHDHLNALLKPARKKATRRKASKTALGAKSRRGKRAA